VAQRIYAIVAGKVEETGMVSFKFIFSSGAPYPEVSQVADVFGVVFLREKSDGYLDPFRLARGEAGAVGPDGFKRWEMSLFQSGGIGQILGLGLDEDQQEEKMLQANLRDELPDCVLLMDTNTYQRFEPVCKTAGVELSTWCYDGVLRTS
jgi:hypothetical protein